MFRALAQHWTARLAALPAALLGIVLSLFASAGTGFSPIQARLAPGTSRTNADVIRVELGAKTRRVPTVATLAMVCAAALAAAIPRARRPVPLPPPWECAHAALVRDGILLPILR